ncbi:MAG TPA: pitrilysin family protein, partial [Pseudomonadales bacterium]|nr:pitrilysin family protein [Pseudomonadales bacterium]
FGTERMGRVEFQAALDAIGASENAGTSFGVQTLASSFDKGVALLADNELHPALPKRAFEIVQQQYAALLHTRNQSPGFLVHKSLVKALFPENDPTLRDATPETVHSLSMDDVHNYYRQVYRPDLTTVVVMGRITPDAAKAVVQKYFGGWTATGPTPETELPAVPDNKPGTVNVPDTSRVQDVVILAQTMGVTRKDKDYYPIALGDAVLGGSFYSTRLSIDLRKNSGLVYSVGTGLEAGKNRSIYIVQYACDPQNVSKARDIVNQDLAAMQNKPVPEDELRRTKALLLRQIPLGESSVDAIAGSLINRQETGLPLDEPTVAAKRYIDLTPADVMAAFKKWMRPNDLVQVSQGPAPK